MQCWQSKTSSAWVGHSNLSSPRLSLNTQARCPVSVFTLVNLLSRCASLNARPSLTLLSSHLSKASAATTPRTAPPTAPATASWPTARRRWRRRWPPSDPSPWRLTPRGPDLLSSTAVRERSAGFYWLECRNSTWRESRCCRGWRDGARKVGGLIPSRSDQDEHQPTSSLSPLIILQIIFIDTAINPNNSSIYSPNSPHNSSKQN